VRANTLFNEKRRNLPPGCVELNEEVLVLDDLSVKVGVGKNKNSVFLLDFLGMDSKGSNGNANSG